MTGRLKQKDGSIQIMRSLVLLFLILDVDRTQSFTLLRPVDWTVPVVAPWTPEHGGPRDQSCTVVFGIKSFFLKRAIRRRRIDPTSGAVDDVVEEQDTDDRMEYETQEDSAPQAARQPVLVLANSTTLTLDGENYYEPHARQSTMSNNSYGERMAASFVSPPPSFDLSVPVSQRLEESGQRDDSFYGVATLVSAPQNLMRSLVEEVAVEEEAKFCSMATLVALRKIPLDSLDKPLYLVAPVNGTLSQLEQEFRNMLESFSNYSQRDIMSLKEENVRILFEGVAACAYETAVYRAFEVLFEDLYPLRVAARVIYEKLRKLMEDSKMQREADVDAVVSATGLDPFQVETTWLLFITTATKINHGAFLTKEQLISTGFLNELQDSLTQTSIEYLTKRMDKAKGGKITFTDFIFALDECVNQECSIERPCDPLVVLGTTLRTIGETSLASVEEVLDEKKLSYWRRYDHMLNAFRDWRGLVPEGTGRRMDVIRGCFVGAENEKVVRALRICYMDYAGLRMAAELIFKLVKTFMASRERTLQSKSQH